LVSCRWEKDSRIIGGLDWDGEIEVGARRDLDFLSMSDFTLQELVIYKQSSPNPSMGQEDGQYFHFGTGMVIVALSDLEERVVAEKVADVENI
jgi:hypothetical protein